MPNLPAILFEDEDLLALDKPSGLLTEGGGERESDLEQLATAHAGRRVRCCHRLDRLTSGVVLLRKNARHTAKLAALFGNRQTTKIYWAVVEGAWPAPVHKVETQVAPQGGGRWANVASGGKVAVSLIRVLAPSPDGQRTWLSVRLQTGRTHQARLHCAHTGCPIVGDPGYGRGADDFFGLHARELSFRHPATGAPVTVSAPVPDNWPTWVR